MYLNNANLPMKKKKCTKIGKGLTPYSHSQENRRTKTENTVLELTLAFSMFECHDSQLAV